MTIGCASAHAEVLLDFVVDAILASDNTLAAVFAQFGISILSEAIFSTGMFRS
jgi:hypothetical protein